MKALLNARFLILIPFFFIACKKSDTPAPAALKTYLTKTNHSALGIFTYTYDANNKLLTEVYASNGSNPSYTNSFTGYDAQGRVTEFITDYTAAANPDIKTVVRFNAGGKIDSMFFSLLSGGPVTDYSIYTYPAGKQIEKNYNNANVLSSSYEHTFSVDGKNVIETKTYNAAAVLRSTWVYSNYDTKKNNDLLLPYGYYPNPVSENNFQNFTNTNHITSGVTSSSRTYEYNSDGYVTKRTSSTGSITLFEYIQK
jgi:YD repeat-containing protein